MRFIETKKLNDYIIGTGSFFEDDLKADLDKKLDSLESVSLQSFSIEHDRSFLREVSSVLNVIVSIIYHPHISNKREEVIIRIEQAQQVGQDAFLATIKDGKLWKKHGVKMIPEEVYYHQHEDELRIYENRFIGFLIDLIDRELAKFSAFYISRLPTLTSLDKALDTAQIGDVIMDIDRLKRKTHFIKNTYFYKQVSKGTPISSKIQPTNILLKDRLYRYCFKFYKSIARYEDVSVAKCDLRAYYMILLFKELRRCGFELTFSEKGRYEFKNSDFLLFIEAVEDGSLALSVTYHNIPEHSTRHVLDFCVETEKQLVQGSVEALAGTTGIEAISLWDMRYADSSAFSGLVRGTEEELIRAWLATKINKITADKNVYKKYCPVCGSRGVNSDNGVHSCYVCSSSYVFDERYDGNTVWFRRIRKRGNS